MDLQLKLTLKFLFGIISDSCKYVAVDMQYEMRFVFKNIDANVGSQARQTGGWWTAALVIKLTSDVWSGVQVAEHVDARVKTCFQHAHLIRSL